MSKAFKRLSSQVRRATRRSLGRDSSADRAGTLLGGATHTPSPLSSSTTLARSLSDVGTHYDLPPQLLPPVVGTLGRPGDADPDWACLGMDEDAARAARHPLLAEYCFNIAYISDWMNGDIPPPISSLPPIGDDGGTPADKKKKKKKKGLFKFAHHSSSSSPRSSDAESHGTASPTEGYVPGAPVKLGPLALYVMELFQWEPPEGYQYIDVQMLFLHLKAFVDSASSLTSARGAHLASTHPPRFLLRSEFPSEEHFRLRNSHIQKAMRAEIALLADDYPALMQTSLGFVSSNVRLPPAPPLSSASMPFSPEMPNDALAPDSHSLHGMRGGGESASDSDGSVTSNYDWIRILVPDDPHLYLKDLLGMFSMQLMADDHLPMDRKSKALLDRVCQFWRVGPVTKEVLLARWVLDALQQQDVATLWGCLTVRIDKLELTVRRERETMSKVEQSLTRSLISALIRHAKWYVSGASDDAISDLGQVFAMFKHVDAVCELLEYHATGQVAEAFAHGYTRRMLQLRLGAPVAEGAHGAASGAEIMASINQGADELMHMSETLPLPPIQRLHVAYLLAHSFLMSASEMCPVALPDKEVREELTLVCHQYRRMRDVEELMHKAADDLVHEATAALDDASLPVERRSQLEHHRDMLLTMLRDKPRIEFVWDEWLLQLEDDLCEEVEHQIDEQQELAAAAGGDMDNIGLEPSDSPLVKLMDLLSKYLTYIESFPFPSSHHFIRMVKALTRIFTRAISRSAHLMYRHILDASYDRASLQRGTLTARLRQLQHARDELGAVQRAVQHMVRSFDLSNYVSPYPRDEVMLRVDVEKPAGKLLDVRINGEFHATTDPMLVSDTFFLPAIGERTVDVMLRGPDADGNDEIVILETKQAVSLMQADQRELIVLFPDTPDEVLFTVHRAEDCYAQVYFQNCWDSITNTLDSLVAVVSDKVAQQILVIAKEYKKFLKRQPAPTAATGFLQQLQKSAPVVQAVQAVQASSGFEGQLSSLFGSLSSFTNKVALKRQMNAATPPPAPAAAPSAPARNPLHRKSLPDEDPAAAKFRLAQGEELAAYLRVLAKVIADLEGRGEGGALAAQLCEGVWQTLSARLAQHLLRNKAGTKMKERPQPYVEWLHQVVVRVRDTLFPVDEDGASPLGDDEFGETFTRAPRVAPPQSYLLVLLSRYSMDTDALQQEYLANIMSYLDFKSQLLAHRQREAAEAAEAAAAMSLVDRKSRALSRMDLSAHLNDECSEDLIMGGHVPPSSPREPAPSANFTLTRRPTVGGNKGDNGKDALLARITSNRQSMFFDSNLFLFKEGGSDAAAPGPMTLMRQKTLQHRPVRPSPLKKHVNNDPEHRPVRRHLAVSTVFDNRPISMLSTATRLPASALAPVAAISSRVSLISGAGSIAPSDPVHYPLFAVLAILRMRAEADPEIRAWLDEQKAVEETIMASMNAEQDARANGAADVGAAAEGDDDRPQIVITAHDGDGGGSDTVVAG
ncbi:hypothetical protein AMAG_01938 [Allomyces macrogynus ATCC 38327]|uniref:MHD2 domain-containing protein n=1 Tax=Allomyces macrogynus (strain ATCC 38327) TaxID=578462 RepID=A0A0L0S137_ALLM3|nr:hypothetical protein AMAG_01938 [Allomyces macrogynus ATCC 38327]|eukprot:KNE56096.1 hypothetical protein AMAG_01938 [Allomyces macrogynus ATCC 38327]